MTLSPITPGNTPRQVIPFGDRPIVDASGRPTPEFYQWCNRVSGGLTSSITNISTTITETNTISETVNNISVDVSGIEAEIATIDTTLGVLQGEIAAVQFEATSIPTPPPPAVPAAAIVARVAVPPPAPARPMAPATPPPAPARWAGSADFVELEAGSNPTKISAMSDLNLSGPPTGSEKLAGESGGATNLGVKLSTLFELFVNWLNYIGANPLNNGSGAGLTVKFVSGAGDATHNSGDMSLQSSDATTSAATGQAFVFSGNNAGTGVSGDAGTGTGNTASATSGQAFVYTGDSTSGDTGAVNVGSGTATAGTSGIVTIGSGPGNATGAFFLQSGPAAAGNSGVVELQTGNAAGGDSGNVTLQTGTATGTRGNVTLDGLLVVLVGLPTVAPVTSGAVWRDAGAGNVLKAVP